MINAPLREGYRRQKEESYPVKAGDIKQEWLGGNPGLLLSSPQRHVRFRWRCRILNTGLSFARRTLRSWTRCHEQAKAANPSPVKRRYIAIGLRVTAGILLILTAFRVATNFDRSLEIDETTQNDLAIISHRFAVERDAAITGLVGLAMFWGSFLVGRNRR